MDDRSCTGTAETKTSRKSTLAAVRRLLAPATIVRGASWASDGTILYAKGDGIWAVRDGEEPKLLIPVEQGRVHGPQMLPDGRSVLFTRLLAQDGWSWAGAEIVVRDLESGQEKVLLAGEDGRYVPTGHLVYALDTTLFAVPFDAANARVTGGVCPSSSACDAKYGSLAIRRQPTTVSPTMGCWCTSKDSPNARPWSLETSSWSISKGLLGRSRMSDATIGVRGCLLTASGLRSKSSTAKLYTSGS